MGLLSVVCDLRSMHTSSKMRFPWRSLPYICKFRGGGGVCRVGGATPPHHTSLFCRLRILNCLLVSVQKVVVRPAWNVFCVLQCSLFRLLTHQS